MPEKKEKKEKKVIYLKKEDEKTILALIDRQVNKAPVVIQHFDKWRELIDWTDLGKQFFEWKSGSSRPVKLKNRKKRVVVNQMKPLSEAIEGKINMMHRLVGFPKSSENIDINASKVATKLLSHNDYVNGAEAMYEDLLYDLVRTGNAWVKVHWDKGMKGKLKNGKKQKGEVALSVPSVFNIRPDPTASRREDMRWIIEIADVTYDEIRQSFDVTEEDLNKAAGNSKDIQSKYKVTNEKIEDKDPDEKTALVKYYWERKTTKYPKGRHFIVVGNLFLWKGPNAELGEIPFFHFGYKRYASSLWHTGPMYHVQDLQREYNRTISMISEHIEAWRPKMQVGPGAIIKRQAFTFDNFEIVEIDSSKGDVKPIPMPELSAQVMAYRDFIDLSFGKVSNVHEVSYAQLPKYASRAPASLFSMMLEQENVKIDPMIKRMNEVVRKMGKFRLRMIDKYYTHDRLVQVVGKDSQSQVEYFKGADLKGNFDVVLDIGISLNQSKVSTQRLLIEMFEKGIIEDKNKLLKLLDEGDISTELRGDIADETRAQRENQAFENGTYKKDFKAGGVKIYVHDDDDKHLIYHTNYRKTEEVQMWDKKKLTDFDAHIGEHWKKLNNLKTLMGAMVGNQPGQGNQPGASSGLPASNQPGSTASPVAPVNVVQ